MNVLNLISSEMRFPSETSKKKKRTDLEHLRYKGTELIKGGSTELYNEDILNYIRALI